MKWLLPVALLVGGTALPGWAQRGGARGGGAGHGVAMVSRGGFASSSRFSYASARTGAGGVYSGALPSFRGGPSVPVRRPVYGGPGLYQAPYASVPYGFVAPYGVAGWWGPDSLDFADAGPSYSAAAPPYYPGGDPAAYGAGPMEQAPPAEAYRPAYAAQPPPADEEAVTLIFKDGRPSEQIHNYILTAKTLYVQDEHRQVIPVEQLDLSATEKANLDAGVEFQLPSLRR